MFRIKICGITNVDDALAATRAGVDALGLNFYPKSRRYLDPDLARPIVEAVSHNAVKVGLFVNASVDHVQQTFDRLGLDLIQLHGDEPPEFLAELGNRPVMRAFRLGPAGSPPVAEYLGRCRRMDCLPRLVLIDAHVKGEYGGTGKVADWPAAKEYAVAEGGSSLVLAGGLTPDNVAEAIHAVSPAAVDTAGGVESSPGKKDPAMIEAFVRAARLAFGD